ncbi:hypothetical protein J4731_23585 [Providencia rettgeri]|nr:hypothetical protein [Providencia rettgeri]
MDNKLVEIIENPNHPWFVACRSTQSSPLHQEMVIRCFAGFVKAAGTRKVS